jgi:NAD(P)-dependent dehydrogenase (short-subunit alcohol dehydrogenase family)
MATKTFFITGVSSGLGLALGREAVEAGHKVVGTLHNEKARADFDALSPGRAFGKVLDITDTTAIAGVIGAVESEIGPIDVLVNNAGYGYEGRVEETPLGDMRHQFEVNVFGAVAMIQAVLPGIAAYHGSKFALEGISETLGKEVKGFGIAVTGVEPGMFRTDWAGRSMVRAQRKIADYDALFEPIRAARQARSGNQPGDPVKAARAILQIVEDEHPPAHFPLGPDALKLIREALAAREAELKQWEAISSSTDFDQN